MRAPWKDIKTIYPFNKHFNRKNKRMLEYELQSFPEKKNRGEFEIMNAERRRWLQFQAPSTWYNVLKLNKMVSRCLFFSPSQKSNHLIASLFIAGHVRAMVVVVESSSSQPSARFLAHAHTHTHTFWLLLGGGEKNACRDPGTYHHSGNQATRWLLLDGKWSTLTTRTRPSKQLKWQ